MPRAPRVHLQDVIYYVTLDGPQGESIFKDDADYQKYLELLQKYKSEFKFSLFSYVLLPERLELLIEVSEEFPISVVMQKITPLYTKYYNNRYQRKGPLFQKRFRSVIVEKENYLPALTRHVHQAPVRSGVCESLKDFSYSSYSIFSPEQAAAFDSRNSSIDLSAEVQVVLEHLARVKYPGDYAHFILEGDKEDLNELDRKLARGSVIGSDEFVSQIKRKMKEGVKKDTYTAAANAPAGKWGGVPAFAGTMSRGIVLWSSVLVFAALTTAFSVNMSNHAPNDADLANSQVNTAASANLVAGVINKEAASQPVDLNGTIWEVELVSVSPDGTETPIKDKIKFNGRAFESYHFASQGFSRSNYTVTVQDNGEITWQTMQSNTKGETISWRGDWNGKKMEGLLNYHPEGKNNQDFSFVSNRFTVQR